MVKFKVGDEVAWTERTSPDPASEIDLEGVILKIIGKKAKVKIVQGGSDIVIVELKYLEKI